jgi:hemoglobin
MKEIENRADIQLLVHLFYDEVRLNSEIGPFFNKTILDWDHHLEKLTDFWESNLLFAGKYRGRPGRSHIMVDQKFNHQLEAKHFGVWLNLWIQTLDANFEGGLAERAKANARKMATNFQMKIFMARSR